MSFWGILLILKALANFGDDTFVGALQKLCGAASVSPPQYPPRVFRLRTYIISPKMKTSVTAL